jgi:hypothetical protein
MLGLFYEVDYLIDGCFRKSINMREAPRKSEFIRLIDTLNNI